MLSFCGTVVRYFAAAEVGFYWQQMCSFLRRSKKPLFLLVGITGNELSGDFSLEMFGGKQQGRGL